MPPSLASRRGDLGEGGGSFKSGWKLGTLFPQKDVLSHKFCHTTSRRSETPETYWRDPFKNSDHREYLHLLASGGF